MWLALLTRRRGFHSYSRHNAHYVPIKNPIGFCLTARFCHATISSQIWYAVFLIRSFPFESDFRASFMPLQTASFSSLPLWNFVVSQLPQLQCWSSEYVCIEHSFLFLQKSKIKDPNFCDSTPLGGILGGYQAHPIPPKPWESGDEALMFSL